VNAWKRTGKIVAARLEFSDPAGTGFFTYQFHQTSSECDVALQNLLGSFEA
jgi:hypothetical protein